MTNAIDILNGVADALVDLTTKVDQHLRGYAEAQDCVAPMPPPHPDTPPPPSGLVFPPKPPAPKDLTELELEALRYATRG